MRFYQLGETVFEKTYKLGQGFSIGNDGKIKISGESTCESFDSPGLGCHGNSIRLFVNGDGDLAVIYSNSGGGLLGVVPVAVHLKSLLVLPNVGRDPRHAP